MERMRIYLLSSLLVGWFAYLPPGEAAGWEIVTEFDAKSIASACVYRDRGASVCFGNPEGRSDSTLNRHRLERPLVDPSCQYRVHVKHLNSMINTPANRGKPEMRERIYTASAIESVDLGLTVHNQISVPVQEYLQDHRLSITTVGRRSAAGYLEESATFHLFLDPRANSVPRTRDEARNLLFSYFDRIVVERFCETVSSELNL